MKKLWQDINTYFENTLPPTGVTPPQKTMTLNGKWQFKFFDSVNDVPENYYNKDFETNFDLIDVPSNWQLKGYGIPNYSNIRYPYPVESKNKKLIPKIHDEINPAGIYKRKFDIKDLNDKIYLQFGGINSSGTVFVNGEYVGYSEDSFDSVTYDITPYLSIGENELTVLVVQYSTGSYLEDQDMWRLAGIFRDVTILFVPKTNIEDVFLTSELFSNYSDASLIADIKTDGDLTDVIVKLSLFNAQDEILYTASENATITIKFVSPKLSKIKLWSHEEPNLYNVVIELIKGETVLDKRVFKHGFRCIEIVRPENEQPYIALNGRLIKICGVNRHDFHPDYGHAVPQSIIDSDLVLLKANNITSVRTCHYPNSPYFYSKCDELGILVMSENNLETHGLAKIIPASDEKWSKHCCFRMQNMVHTHKNHPSIVFWSLGNEAGVGKSFMDMRNTALNIDKTRIIHYEPMPAASDVLSQMYTLQTKMKKIADNKTIIHSRALWNNMLGMLMLPSDYKNKPFILCEYAHCMGNSLGNFSDYWKDIEDNPRLVGGYIWDFSDQSIKRVNDKGETEWTMGGDWGDKPNDGVFAFNGIVRADRSPNPALFEVKKQHERIKTLFDGKELTVINKRSHTNLSDVYIEIVKLENGIKADSVKLNIPPVAPNKSEQITVPSAFLKGNGEVVLSIYYRLKQKTPYAPKDHCVATAEFILKSLPLPKTIGKGAPTIFNEGDKITIKTNKGSYVFNRKTGGIDSAIINDEEMLTSPIKPNFWRAFTNNDKYPPNDIIDIVKVLRLDKFKKASKKLKPRFIEATLKCDSFVINILWRMPLISDFETIYTFTADGILNVNMRLLPLRNMVRYGITFMLKDGIDGIEFYGKGPHENYCDRATSAMLGQYTGVAEDFIHDYLSPQENGNHMGVRYLQVGNLQKGVRIDAESHPFEASVHPYTVDMLDEATHLHKLKRLSTLTINIDGGQRGVGGDIPALAATKKQYKLRKFKQYSMSCTIKFYND